MIATDPTLQALAQLDDTNAFVPRHNVPIFKPHVRKDKEGRELYAVDEKRLQKIADRCNERYLKDGIPIIIKLGHTKPGADEDEQPEVLGYGRGAFVGPWGPRQELGLLCRDFLIRKDAYEANGRKDLFKNNPFRSVEYYPGVDEITAVSMLNRDPELDMGMLAFERGGNKGYFYSSKELSMEKEVEPDKGGEHDIDEKEKDKFCRYMKHCYPALHGMHHSISHHYAETMTGPGVGGPGNGYIPGAVKQTTKKHAYERETNGDTTVETKTETPAVPVARSQQVQGHALVNETAQLYQKVQELQAEIKTIRRESEMVKYEARLAPLVEPLELDMNEERDTIKDMNPEQFEHYAKRLEKLAIKHRSPVGAPMIRTDGVTPKEMAAGDKPISKEESKRAANLVTYQRENGNTKYTFAEAVKEIRSGK